MDWIEKIAHKEVLVVCGVESYLMEYPEPFLEGAKAVAEEEGWGLTDSDFRDIEREIALRVGE